MRLNRMNQSISQVFAAETKLFSSAKSSPYTATHFVKH